MNGKFISFEGIEGSGKSSQAQYLHSKLIHHHIPTILTHEPGATALGQIIRNWILDTPESTISHPATELLLFTADRLEHISTIIDPNLSAGNWVICDRFIDSTYAYQAGGRQIPLSTVESIANLVHIRPSLTFFLDVNPEIGISRVHRRGTSNRFDAESIAFFNRVRKMYLARIEKDPERFITIDTSTRSEAEVSDYIWQTILMRYLQNL